MRYEDSPSQSGGCRISTRPGVLFLLPAPVGSCSSARSVLPASPSSSQTPPLPRACPGRRDPGTAANSRHLARARPGPASVSAKRSAPPPWRRLRGTLSASRCVAMPASPASLAPRLISERSFSRAISSLLHGDLAWLVSGFACSALAFRV